MRERVGHERTGHERRGRARAGRGRWGRLREWGSGAGPRPVRPGVVPLPVRPPEAPRPVGPPGRPVVGVRWVERLALGLLARAVAPDLAPAPVPASSVVPSSAVPSSAPVVVPIVVVAEAGETVWEVVDRVAPGAPGAERAALAERIVVDNGLRSVRLQPGQVLRVSPG
jgi:hypothetical protein